MLKGFKRWRVASIYLDRLIDKNTKIIEHTNSREHDIPSELTSEKCFQLLPDT